MNATRLPSALIIGAPDSSSDGASFAKRLASCVAPVPRSRTNTSATPLLSFGTRLLARLANATRLPSALIDGPPNPAPALRPPGPKGPEGPLPAAPSPLARLTSTVWLVTLSRTNTFVQRLSSTADISSASETNATYLPSALTVLTPSVERPTLRELESFVPLLKTPWPDGRETSRVGSPIEMTSTRLNTWLKSSSSSGWKLSAWLSNTTRVPVGEIDAEPEPAVPTAAPTPRLAKTVASGPGAPGGRSSVRT